MPAYLDRAVIDWSWPSLNDAEQGTVRLFEARHQADPGTHTLDTFKAALASVSSKLPGRTLRARAQDEHGSYELVASAGAAEVSESAGFDDSGVFKEALSPDDFRAAGVEKLWVGLYFPAPMLAAVKGEATRADKSLSFVVQTALRAGFGLPADAPTHDFGSANSDKRKQSVYLPLDLYTELRGRADREDRSLSWVAQSAIARGWPDVTALPTVE